MGIVGDWGRAKEGQIGKIIKKYIKIKKIKKRGKEMRRRRDRAGAISYGPAAWLGCVTYRGL